MRFSKSLKMIPIAITLTGNVYASHNTNFLFNEDDIKSNLIQVDANTLKDSQRINSFLFDEHSTIVRVRGLLKKWQKETMFLSDVNKIRQNENYKKIVALGVNAVPSILNELSVSPSKLVWGLNEILDFKISKEPLSVNDACRLWVNWGINSGLIK